LGEQVALDPETCVFEWEELVPGELPLDKDVGEEIKAGVVFCCATAGQWCCTSIGVVMVMGEVKSREWSK